MSAPGPVLALDLGERRIGVAVSDANRILARPLRVLERGGELPFGAIVALVAETGATEVVVGLPLELSGRPGPAANAASAAIAHLAELLEVPVVAHDERLTTVEATRRLAERRRLERGSRRAPKRRAVVDDLAATVLLDAYLGRRSR